MLPGRRPPCGGVGSRDLWWLNAASFPLEWSNQEVADIADQLKQRMALLLSEGLTDRTIAKRMGMSVRTCRRHIAEIMERLGVKSRFQAGFLLSARTESSPPPRTPKPLLTAERCGPGPRSRTIRNQPSASGGRVPGSPGTLHT
ncbi:helix-turn-helix transcriptional regulator [Streptomyces sp. ADI98-10]|uniref:helix-turn-helix domain-containing protein n=1 Tax=Streptomyces sp. ADI98-10 TaxID=1522763 RepID=UPI0022781B6C|nr:MULTISPECIES: helix-turn-helix transcriptional regulator [Streptomyces]